jgi:hypothetical protein
MLYFSPHSTFCTFFPLLPFIYESCHHFSPSCTLSPQIFRNFLCHTPFILFYLDSLILALLSCLSVSLSLSLSSTFIHLPFALFFTGISVPLVLLPSLVLLRVLLLFSPASRQYPALFPFIHFVLKLCRSLFHFHSHHIPLALSLPPLVPSIPRFLPCTLIRSLPYSQTSFSSLFSPFPTHIPLPSLPSSLSLSSVPHPWLFRWRCSSILKTNATITSWKALYQSFSSLFCFTVHS